MSQQFTLLVLPNPHCKSKSKKLKLTASTIEDLAAQAADEVKLGEDAVLCRPTDADTEPTEADIYTSLEELGGKAKVMVWPESTLYPVADAEADAEPTVEDAEAGLVALSLACPDDCGPGDSVTVEVDGVQVEVEIPDGVAPGDEFEVHIDMGSDAVGDHAEAEEDRPADAAEERVLILMVISNPHCKSNKKLKLTASSIEDLAAQVGDAVRLGEDAILCAPTDAEPTEAELCTSLGALGGKAKVMVWPEAVLYPAIAAGDEEHEAAEEEERAAEEEERALEAEFEAASVEVVEQPAAAMDLQPPMDPPREFILMIMPNEHVKSNKKLNCSPTTLADLAAQVGTACKIDGEVMICLPAASPTAADRLTSLDQLDSKAKIMAWPASRFDAGGTAAAEAEALAEQSAAVLDAAAVTAAAVRAEEEAEAAAAEEAHLDVEIAAAQAAADEAEAYAEAAASVEMVRGKMGWALENETNPDKLTELVLESLDFGGALETERMAIQSRFEGMLQTQEEERLTSKQVEEAENAAVQKKGLRRLSIAPGSLLKKGQEAAGSVAAPRPAAAAARGAGRRLSLAVGGGKKDTTNPAEMDALAAMAAAASAEFDNFAGSGGDDAHSSTSSYGRTSGTEPLSPRAGSAGSPQAGWPPTSLERACINGNFDRAVRTAHDNPGMLTEKNRGGMLPLHEMLRHDAPIDAVRALVELAPETLLIVNDNGRTPFEVAQRGFKPDPELLIYLEQAAEAHAANAAADMRGELPTGASEGPHEFMLMVMANDHCPSTKKLQLEASSLEDLAAQVGEAVNLGMAAVLCAPTDRGIGAPYTSLDGLGEKAKVMVWPAASLGLSSPAAAGAAGIGGGFEDDAIFAASAGIMAARAVDEEETRHAAEEEHKIFTEMMEEEETALAEEAAEAEEVEKLEAEVAAQAEIDSARREAAVSAKEAAAGEVTASLDLAEKAEAARATTAAELEALRVQLRESQAAGASTQTAAAVTLAAAAEELAALRTELSAAQEEKQVEVAIVQEESERQMQLVETERELLEDAESAHAAKCSEMQAQLDSKAEAAEERDIDIAMLQQEKEEADRKCVTLAADLAAKVEELQMAVETTSTSTVSKELYDKVATDLSVAKEAHSDEVASLKAQLSAAADEREFDAQEKEDDHASQLVSLREQLVKATRAAAAAVEVEKQEELAAMLEGHEAAAAAAAQELSAAQEEKEIEVAMAQQETSDAEALYTETAASLEAAQTEAVVLTTELESMREAKEIVEIEVEAALEAHAAEVESVRASLSGTSSEIEATLRGETDSLRAAHDTELATLREQMSTAADEREFEAKEKEDGHASQLASLRETHEAAAAAAAEQLAALRVELSAAQEEQKNEVAMAQQEREEGDAQALQGLRAQLDAAKLQVANEQAAKQAMAGERAQLLVQMDVLGMQGPGGGPAAEDATEPPSEAPAFAPALSDARKIGVPPTLRRQLKSVAAVQTLAAGNEAVLSIAAELSLWPAVRENSDLRKKLYSSGLPEGIPNS